MAGLVESTNRTAAGEQRTILRSETHVGTLPSACNCLTFLVLVTGSVAAQQHPVTFTVSSRPVLLLGGLKSDVNAEFRSGGAYLNGMRLSDGRVVVIDTDRVRYFAADGRELPSVGREGGGPGEFRLLTTICRTRGDTVVVWDDRGKRVGILTGSGRFVRHLSLTLDYPADGACSLSGGILLTGIGPDSGMVRRMVGTGRVVETDSTSIGSSFTFNPGSMDAVGRAPSVLIVDSTLYLAEAVRPVIEVMTVDGRRIADIPIWRSPARISDRDYDRLVAKMIPDQPNTAAIRRQLKARRSATHWPAYGRVLADPEGCLWVEEWGLNSDRQYRPSGRWAGISRDGRMTGFLHLDQPGEGSPVHLLRIDRSEAVLRESDADGVPYLAFRDIKSVEGARPPC